MRVLDLFSGIGGFSLGLERAGMETAAFCEIEPFCRKVLRKHWSTVPIYEDIRELTADRLENDGIRDIGLICGGYPCQPFSTAGKRRGEKDDRHLWPEMFRLVETIRPQWVIGENVAGHISMGLDEVLSDLEGIGYACWPFVIPACAVDAPHRRDRVWIVAQSERTGAGGISGAAGQQRRDPVGAGAAGLRQRNGPAMPSGKRADSEVLENADSQRFGQSEICGQQQGRTETERGSEAVADAASKGRNTERGAGQTVSEPGPLKRSSGCGEALADSNRDNVQGEQPGIPDQEVRGKQRERLARPQDASNGGFWLPEPNVGRVAHGVPSRVDRLRSLGNAVVPQVVEVIGRAVMGA